MNDLLLNYAKYNLWANKRITDKFKDLSAEAWIKEQKSSFPSLRQTLLHIYDAETIWYNRLIGISLTKWPSERLKCTKEEATQLMLEASKNLVEFLNVLTSENLNLFCDFRSLEGKEYSMKVYDLIHHCLNHSTYHRGQLVTMLRNLDIDDIPSTDYIAYLRQNGQ
ncbi:MAG: DinB family protein [Ignavibacteria bacterium]|nr:DinB family protein [Ignavibacteria bacterium]